jgi:hypothetical protein
MDLPKRESTNLKNFINLFLVSGYFERLPTGFSKIECFFQFNLLEEKITKNGKIVEKLKKFGSSVNSNIVR